MTEPDYFDSQAQAAAALSVGIDEIREAKRQGCAAFRSGRVYRRPLLEWLGKQQRPVEAVASASDDSPCLPLLSETSWQHRRDVLFEMLAFLHAAHARGEITPKQYVSMGDRLMPLLLKMADVLEIPAVQNDAYGRLEIAEKGGEIDRAGWLRTWRACRQKALRGE